MNNTVYQSLYCDIKYELENVNFENKEEAENSYYYVLSIFESKVNDNEILDWEAEKMRQIIENDTISLQDAYFGLLNYLEMRILYEKA